MPPGRLFDRTWLLIGCTLAILVVYVRGEKMGRELWKRGDRLQYVWLLLDPLPPPSHYQLFPWSALLPPSPPCTQPVPPRKLAYLLWYMLPPMAADLQSCSLTVAWLWCQNDPATPLHIQIQFRCSSTINLKEVLFYFMLHVFLTYWTGHTI